ncbi:hypothetical protein ABK040_003287 [Willaertia magna]
MSQQPHSSCERTLNDIDEQKSICEIIPNKLYLGSAFGASDLNLLQKIGITGILNVTKEIENYFPNQFQYKNIVILDNYFITNIENYFDNAIQFIQDHTKEGNVCYVHCVQGISRSASMILAYLMKIEKMTLRDAFLHTFKCRSEIFPNQGFIKALMRKELEWLDLKENTWSLQDMDCIELFNQYKSKYSFEEIQQLMKENNNNSEKVRMKLFKQKL